jgi:hypothetical protein
MYMTMIALCYDQPKLYQSIDWQQGKINITACSTHA